MTASQQPTARAPKVALLSETQLVEAPANEIPQPLLQDEPLTISRPRFGFRLSKLFWASTIALLGLSIGLWVESLVLDLFQRTDWLGYIGLALVGVIALTLLIFIGREVFALMRLSKIQGLQDRAHAVLGNNQLESARSHAKSLLQLYERAPQTAKARDELSHELTAIHDPKDLLLLSETLLMTPLDQQANQIIMQSAKRISLVTAISPRALIDVLFVGYENLRLIRRLFVLYGGRPGIVGLVKIARQSIANIAISGGLSATDGVVQGIFGHGLAAKLSSRLGEGVVNGMLTARIGRSAMIACRPMPFLQTKPPSMKSILAEIAKTSEPD